MKDCDVTGNIVGNIVKSQANGVDGSGGDGTNSDLNSSCRESINNNNTLHQIATFPDRFAAKPQIVLAVRHPHVGDRPDR